MKERLPHRACSTVALAIVAATLSAAPPTHAVDRTRPLPATPDRELVDLTHTLDETFPFIPVPGITFPFALQAIATIERHGVAANRWAIHEHLGTQIDAPNHFAPGGKGLHELTAEELVVPAVVIDFRKQGLANSDAELHVDDIRHWGRWRSVAPEPIERADGSVVYLQREFRFDGDRWSIDFTTYTDAAGKDPLFAGHNSGRFSIGAYRALDPSHEAYFGFEQRRLTPLAPAIAEALTAAGCGSAPWVVGAEQDLTEHGCPTFRILDPTSCPGEYDLVQLTDERLYLGARPADGNLCTPDRRPQQPGVDVLVRAVP